MIYQLGQLNSTALSAPGIYLQIQPPPTIVNGVPSNLLALVGVGSWGPVNAPVLVGAPSDVSNYLGAMQVRKYDVATAIDVAFKQGATAIMYVRVTDGTDMAATATLLDTAGTPAIGATLTAIYTGTGGNAMTASLLTGTKTGTFKLVITRPGVTPEVFDNIPGTGAVLWSNLVNAVNNGQSNVRGPSQLVVASIGPSVAAPNISASAAFAGGLDGTAAVTDATLVGTDTLPRKGMYALRSSGAQVGALIDHSDSTAWSTILGFALQEGIYMGVQAAPGQSYSAVSALLNSAGADGYGIKVLVGDWITYYDAVNKQNRLLGPTVFWAAKQSALAPHLSSLNKMLTGIVSTQRTAQKLPYSGAEVGAAKIARLDLITNPSPGGNYFAMQTGVNASSDPATNGDNYTRMTNYLGLTLAAAFGKVIGQNQTTDLRRDVQTAMQSFLSNLWRQNMIGDVNNPTTVPYTVEIDAANNPSQQVANGYMQADVSVKYLSVIFYFLINLQGGQTVVIQTRSAAAA